ncbi:TPA: hypothetical protein ACGXMW_002257 [Bacillus paranthracis]
MTLIIGVVLPKGILLVSDTRGTYSTTGEVASDFRKKILSITPNVDLAGSGSESNWHASKILRECLFNTVYLNPFRYSNVEIRSEILNLYHHINTLHKNNHHNGDPMGQLLVAEFDNSTFNFNLLQQCGTEGFHTFNILNTVYDVAAIGSSLEIRNNVIAEVSLNLNRIPLQFLNHEKLYIIVADSCHQIIKSQQDSGIGKNIYCSYLTQENGVARHCKFLIKENGEQYQFETDDGLEEIKY